MEDGESHPAGRRLDDVVGQVQQEGKPLAR